MFIQTRNKKGVSIMIGYILLITFAVVIAAVVFQGLKTYVPQEGIDCPTDVSIYVSEYNPSNLNKLTLTIKNNGKFSVGGIFIYYSDNEDREIAPIDLSEYVKNAPRLDPGISFGTDYDDIDNLNSFAPGEEKIIIFDVSEITPISFIEMTPIRWQEEKNRIQKVSCTNAKTKKILNIES